MNQKTEKVCPSCGAVIEGEFCTECGEVIEDELMPPKFTSEEIIAAVNKALARMRMRLNLCHTMRPTERATTNEENILIAMGSKWLNNLCSKDRHCYLVEKSEKQ